MKFQVMSDIHLEHHEDGGAQFVRSVVPSASILVLAGDIVQFKYIDRLIVKSFHDLCEMYDNVLYVTGNHEYYCGKATAGFPDVLRRDNLTVLDNELCTVGDVTFAGTTLWFPDKFDNIFYASSFSDFRSIHGLEEYVYDKHWQSVEFLHTIAGTAEVIITHHAPISMSVPDRFKSNSINRFYHAELDSYINYSGPEIWIHGHMHDPCDYMAADTRVICNPFGYPFEKTEFKYDFVVEM